MAFVGVGGEVFNFPKITSRREQKAIVAIYRKLFPRGSLRLDFAHFPSETVGDGTNPKVAIAPQRLSHLLKTLLRPYLRLGESYMNGEWFITEGELTDFIYLIFNPHHHRYLQAHTNWSNARGLMFFLRQIIFPLSYRKSVPAHYDIDAEFYEKWLDATMQYSCAIFRHGEDTLEEAQQNKMRAIRERLRLEDGMDALEIGSGWGGLSRDIVARHDISLTSVTISQGQYDRAQKEKEKLDAEVGRRLSYVLSDYRLFLNDKHEMFDRVVSIAMLEAVGFGQLPHFFQTIESVLRPNGRALIHTIVRPQPTHINEWINRHIFPGSYVPTLADMGRAIEKTGLDIENIYLIGPHHYYLTLQKWRENFYRAWPSIKGGGYGARFFRMWDFYLAGVQNNFRRDQLNFKIAHVVVSKI
jgi:cyclopropane-fatty-acyl-phospholipid synthase